MKSLKNNSWELGLKAESEKKETIIGLYREKLIKIVFWENWRGNSIKDESERGANEKKCRLTRRLPVIRCALKRGQL